VTRRAGRRVVPFALMASIALGAASQPAHAADTTSVMPSDEEVARAGVLLLSDFPEAWKQSKRSDSSDAALDAAAARIKACAPFLAFSKTNKRNPRATSPNFDREQSNVTNTVSVYPSAAEAIAAMRVFADGRLPKCLESLFSGVFDAQLAKNKKLATQIRRVTTRIAPVDGVRIGDQAVVYQGTVDVALKNGTNQRIGLGVLTIRVGDALAGYSYTADTDISAALQPAIVASVDRLQTAESAA
jgi:hypothetical protein